MADNFINDKGFRSNLESSGKTVQYNPVAKTVQYDCERG